MRIGGIVIELKHIPKDERVKMFHNFEYYSYLIWRKDNCIRGVHKKLLVQVSDKYEQELWVLLTHISRCIRYGSNGYFISFDDHHYTAANKSFKIKVSRVRMRQLIELLDDMQYLTLCLGFYIKDKDSSLSAIILHDKLKTLCTTQAVINQAISRDVDVSNVEVVDVEKTVTVKKYDTLKGKMNKMKKVRLKSTRGVRGITQIRKALAKYNKLIEKHTVTINLGNGDEESNCIVYKRRFENDLHTCGRYYTMSSFQTLPSEYRSSIKIDGETTNEWDFSCCQPFLLSNIDEIELPKDFDCYTIPKLLEVGIDRKVTKQMLFPMLFSKDRSAALKSINLKLREYKIEGVKATYVADAFIEHNSFMNDYYFNEFLYGELQHLDSSIATLVINHFTDKGVVVLCYHDSFRIQDKYSNELYQVMNDSYLSVVGSNKNMVIKLHQ